ncbi:MAG: RNA 2',3'-cyclic phosphodiesterase [Anaerolineales bacterium]|nr:RNA 2',3'-cyclic phosphodiesterase [Anaerolineales bacterium]
MRLFVALELEPPVRQRLWRTQADLQHGTEPEWVRWVQPDGIHLTLKFLGDVEAVKAEAISTALNEATARHPRCAFTVSGLGAFPNPDRARVIWVGLEDPDGTVAALQAGVESALGKLGFEPETKPFRPHLTLGRVRDGIGREPAATLAHLLKTAPALDPLPTTSDKVALIQSQLRPTGAVYRVVSRHVLGGPAERLAEGET